MIIKHGKIKIWTIDGKSIILNANPRSWTMAINTLKACGLIGKSRVWINGEARYYRLNKGKVERIA